MQIIAAQTGLLGCDTVQTVSRTHAQGLYSAGFRFLVRYVTSLSAQERDDILGASLGLSFVSYANSFDPSDEIAALKRLNIPSGATVWLDVEGVHDNPIVLQQRIGGWANALKTAGYEPGMYVGAQSLLTSSELYRLPVVRYWHSCSRVTDRNGQEAGPSCGWAMRQLFPPNIARVGLTIDIDVIETDYFSRQIHLVI
jgi:hypothetical protein